MLTKRIIPCLDVNSSGNVVKGVNFSCLTPVGDPVSLAKRYYKEGADELVFLDVNTNENNRGQMIDIVKRVSQEIFIPFTVGGGIKLVSDMERMLYAGADKISINRIAIENPTIITEGARRYGSQCIVLSVDAKFEHGTYIAYVGGGKINTGRNVISWCEEAVRLGAGEILLTSIDRDGTKKGFNLELTKLVSKRVNVPVIASGGAGKIEDFLDILTAGYADAALAASLFHYKEVSIPNLKTYLLQKNISIRA